MSTESLFDGVRVRNQHRLKRNARHTIRNGAADFEGVDVQSAQFEGREFLLEYEFTAESEEEFFSAVRGIAGTYVGTCESLPLNFGDLVATVTVTTSADEWDAGDVGKWRVPTEAVAAYEAGDLSDEKILERVGETLEEV